MKPNELRIGNLFKDRGGKILRLDLWVGMKLAQRVVLNGFEVHPLTEDLEYCQPIPITEEWLINFGFKKHKCNIGGADMWQGMDAWSINDNNWLFRGNPIDGLKLVGYFNSNIEYVHQLQNLYFALTGIELTYGGNK
jgi:hypothetical protein